jgi:cell division septal protein FtsQ
MKEEKKKLIKLKAELKVYNKIKSKVKEVLDDERHIDELDDYIISKIRKIEEEIYDIDLDDEEVKELAPEYGPSDLISYDGIQNRIMEVHHRDKKYKIQSIHDKVNFVSWNDEKIKKWK